LVAFDVAMQTNTALVTSKERRLFSKREKKEVKQVDWTDVFKLKWRALRWKAWVEGTRVKLPSAHFNVKWTFITH
jgi:hypothetical protein